MTYYLIFGAALGLAGLGCLARRRSPGLGQAMILCGCLGLLGCIAWQLRQNVFAPEPSAPDRGQAVVGYFLANQVLGEIGNQEGQVLLLFPPESVVDSETAGTYAGTFARVLRNFPRLKIETQTLDVPRKNAMKGEIFLAAFRQATSNAPSALAYVSFAGVPPNIDSFQTSASSQAPAFFVFDPWGTTNWLAALKNGRVHCAIVPRPGVRHAAGEAISGEPNEVFNQLYLLATRRNADEIAAKLGMK